MGCVWQEYPALLHHLRIPDSAHVLTGSGMNFMVGRVSYTFGLQGVFRELRPDASGLRSAILHVRLVS